LFRSVAESLCLPTNPPPTLITTSAPTQLSKKHCCGVTAAAGTVLSSALSSHLTVLSSVRTRAGLPHHLSHTAHRHRSAKPPHRHSPPHRTAPSVLCAADPDSYRLIGSVISSNLISPEDNPTSCRCRLKEEPQLRDDQSNRNSLRIPFTFSLLPVSVLRIIEDLTRGRSKA
jgi:hypothetical protein